MNLFSIQGDRIFIEEKSIAGNIPFFPRMIHDTVAKIEEIYIIQYG